MRPRPSGIARNRSDKLSIGCASSAPNIATSRIVLGRLHEFAEPRCDQGIQPLWIPLSCQLATVPPTSKMKACRAPVVGMPLRRLQAAPSARGHAEAIRPGTNVSSRTFDGVLEGQGTGEDISPPRRTACWRGGSCKPRGADISPRHSGAHGPARLKAKSVIRTITPVTSSSSTLPPILSAAKFG